MGQRRLYDSGVLQTWFLANAFSVILALSLYLSLPLFLSSFVFIVCQEEDNEVTL